MLTLLRKPGLTLLRSTGVKMFIILTLALLPLGIIALAASLQAIRTADLEKEALLRVAVTQSARKITAELSADRAALRLTANAMTTGTADAHMCERMTSFLTSRSNTDARFYIYNRYGRPLCGSAQAEPMGIKPAMRFNGPMAQLLGQAGYLAMRTASDDRKVIAISYYTRHSLERIADPTTALQNRQLSLHQGNTQMLVSAAPVQRGGVTSSVASRVEPTDIMLTMTVRNPPETLARTLSLFLPLIMWFFAAAIGWFVVNRLLIRPLVILRKTVAAYQPGEVMAPLARMRTPALEIATLGETFRSISQDVATHEAEMADSLDRQRKLTREVHHRVKNNLQIIASLISLHARAATDIQASDAYASIQRRVDALSVVHRNHFAELEDNRGVGVRALISELSASLRGTAPENARRFTIQIDCDNLHITQDVAVPVAFLLTELVELAMLSDPTAAMRINVHTIQEPHRAMLSVFSPALRPSTALAVHLHDRFDRILTGLSRQLRSPLDYDAEKGDYTIIIPVVEEGIKPGDNPV